MDLAPARIALSFIVLSLLALATLTTAHADRHPVCRAPAYPASTVTENTAPYIPCRTLEEVRALDTRTHVSVMPTGNILRPGQIAIRSHELGLHNSLAFGVTDHVELSVSAPMIPVAMSANVRIGLLPREQPYRLVVSVGAWRQLFDNDDDVIFGTAAITAAYQGTLVNVHASAGALKPFFHDYNGDRDIMVGASVGAIVKTSSKSRIALFGELGRLRVLRDENIASGFMAGIKIFGVRFDVDIGLLMPLGQDDDDELPTLPLISLTYNH